MTATNPTDDLARLRELAAGAAQAHEGEIAEAEECLARLRAAYQQDASWFDPQVTAEIRRAKEQIAARRAGLLAERREELVQERQHLNQQLEELREELRGVEEELYHALKQLPRPEIEVGDKRLVPAARLSVRRSEENLPPEELQAAGLGHCLQTSYPRVRRLVLEEWDQAGAARGKLADFTERFFGKYPALRGKLNIAEELRISEQRSGYGGHAGGAAREAPADYGAYEAASTEDGEASYEWDEER